MRLGALALSVVAAPVQACLLAASAPSLLSTAARQAVREGGQTIERGRALVERAVLLLDVVEVLVAQISATSDRAAVVAASADVTAGSAAEAVSSVEDQLRRTEALLIAYAPALAELQPALSAAGRTLRPQHVEAVVQLLDLTPDALDLIVPALRGMGDLTPELGQLTERLDAVGAIVEGIPGAGLLKRRGADATDSS